MNKRISALLLAGLLAASALACAKEPSANADETKQQNNAEETTAAVTEEERITPDLPERDFEGYEFKVLTKGTTNVHWKSKDIASDGENGEPINDAVFLRNSKISEQFNVTIKDIAPKDYNSLTTEASNAVLSGDNAFDMFSFSVTSLINNNYVYNLYDVPYMDLEQPYYDQNIIESFTLGDKLFAVTGDMIIMDNEATWVVLFNKKLANDYGFADKYGTDLYGLVKDGKYTLDVFNETAAMAAVDLDGDGVMSETADQWGFQTETANNVMLLYGCGEQTIRKDSDGYPVIALEGDKIATAVEKIYEIQNADYAINASLIASKFTDVWSECIDKNYIEGRALYSVAGMNRVTVFRTMDVDFGILPLPKYDEAQDHHYCPVSTGSSNYIAFPATIDNPERNGIIVEALSCESMYTLTHAYYDVTLSGKALRDEESLEMLDIIFGNRIWDLGYAFAWGSITSVVNDASTFASQLASVTPTVEAAIKNTMDVITG